MNERDKDFEPIADWSLEGRRALVDAREVEIRLLLDEAFTDYADRHELAPFGFRGDDPVDEAVSWAIDRFASVPMLDPMRLAPRARGFGLFAEVQWWLAQKVGRRRYQVVASPKASPERREVAETPDDEARLSRFVDRLARSLKTLWEKTCDALVGYWLIGTEPWRREWFGWAQHSDLEEHAGSAKERSERVHDAMFRFSVCFRGGPRGGRPEADAAIATHFSPCANVPPYRVADRVVADTWGKTRVSGPREVGRRRKLGLAEMVRELCAFVLKAEPAGVLERLEWEVVRRAIGLTTLHALEIQDDGDLRSSIEGLPRGTEDRHDA